METVAVDVARAFALDADLNPQGGFAVVAIREDGATPVLARAEADPFLELTGLVDDEPAIAHVAATWATDGWVTGVAPLGVVVGDGRFAAWSGLGGRDADGRHGMDTTRPADDQTPGVLRVGWRLGVLLHAVAGAPGTLADPPAVPGPGAYLAGAWLDDVLARSKVDRGSVARLRLPDWETLLALLDVDPNLQGWAAVHAWCLAQPALRERAAWLGETGTAWEALDLMGSPTTRLIALAEAGLVDVADRVFGALVARGWAAPAGS